MLQKAILILLIVPSVGYATPCSDVKKDYEFAKKYGAHSFYCQDQYDGSATSSWKMNPENYQKFKGALASKNKARFKGVKK